MTAGKANKDTVVCVSVECRSCGRQIECPAKGPVSIVRCAECGTTNRWEQGQESLSPGELLVDSSRSDVHEFVEYHPDK